MRPSRALVLLMVVGAVVGAVTTAVLQQRAWATRNGSGTYSLPAGNPVVSGTAISPTVHNATMSDIATALTGSLAIDGSSYMSGVLRLANGTVGAPGITFATDTDNGLYRIGTNNPAMTAGGVKAQEWAATGSTFPLLSAHTGASTFAAGLTATQSTSNGVGVTSTGNGTGRGGLFTGGSTSGIGVSGFGGAPNGIGVAAEGDGSAAGVAGQGGDASGAGGSFTGGAPNGTGVLGTGTGASYGVQAVGSGSASAYALGVSDYARFYGSNPTSTTAFSNVIAPSSVIKAWGTLTPNGAGSVAVSAGFNVASVTCGNTGNDDYIVTMASAATASTTYAVIPTTGSASPHGSLNVLNVSATVFHIRSAGACDTDTGNNLMGFVVLGLQ